MTASDKLVTSNKAAVSRIPFAYRLFNDMRQPFALSKPTRGEASRGLFNLQDRLTRRITGVTHRFRVCRVHAHSLACPLIAAERGASETRWAFR